MENNRLDFDIDVYRLKAYDSGQVKRRLGIGIIGIYGSKLDYQHDKDGRSYYVHLHY